MNVSSLKSFLLDSNKTGYAKGKESAWIKEENGSTTIVFEKGSWKSHDNFFGGEPYGGRMVVFYKDKPVWIMVYYGWVTDQENPDPVYKTLRSALKRMPIDHPFRGPSEYIEEGRKYTNLWEGDVERFSGEEKIRRGVKLLYKANYRGGLVDVRRGV